MKLPDCTRFCATDRIRLFIHVTVIPLQLEQYEGMNLMKAGLHIRSSDDLNVWLEKVCCVNR